VKEITGQGGIAVPSNDSVDSTEGGAAIVDRAMEEFGRLDAVVSNAGIFDTLPFDELPADSWRRMLNVHLDGSFYLSQPAYRVMKAQGGGRFVFIASSAGLFGQPNSAHYAAAKAGIVGLANVIAIDGAPHGILANTVLPFGYSRMVTETVGDRGSSGRGGGHEAVYCPRLDLRRSDADLFADRDSFVALGESRWGKHSQSMDPLSRPGPPSACRR
jgi:NAD(P)-dependent dehydrogenase (short-subunit alcohol dehydrogenase family)